MKISEPQIELPTFATHLGALWEPEWEYKWILPSSTQSQRRMGWTVVGEPHPFYYGATMIVVGRPKVTQ